VVGFGAPFFGWGWPYYGYGYGYGAGYYPYYSYPPAVVVQPGYTQQETPLPSGYWYFCPSANDYYPHVQSCPEAWIRVAPGTH